MPIFRDKYGPIPDPKKIENALAKLVSLKIQGITNDANAWSEAISALSVNGSRNCPPCLECGALTIEQSDGLCKCGSDRDDCHGCKIWP